MRTIPFDYSNLVFIYSGLMYVIGILAQICCLRKALLLSKVYATPSTSLCALPLSVFKLRLLAECAQPSCGIAHIKHSYSTYIHTRRNIEKARIIEIGYLPGYTAGFNKHMDQSEELHSRIVCNSADFMRF